MNVRTVVWLVFLALIKNFSCDPQTLFTLDDRPLTAKEGSCIEIKCIVCRRVDGFGAYWFWIKNASWEESELTGTVIYSTNSAERPVSPEFADRVSYIGSPSSSWNSDAASQQPLCSVLICNLKKSDSGDYSFRYIGQERWITKPAVILTVQENPCPITFEKPPVVSESGTITLTCSTSASCHSDPQIQDSKHMFSSQPSQPQRRRKPSAAQKSTTGDFTVNWQDDGKVFSCQTQDNNDKYLIRNISVTVEYGPKNTLAEISPGEVVERQSVTLTCSAKGRPEPTFTWFKNNQKAVGRTGAEWAISSVEESQNGVYYCKAQNKYGTMKSNPVPITVTYVPEVEVMSPASVVKQGDNMTLTCTVRRSSPKPHNYAWFKNDHFIGQEQKHWYVERIAPEDKGFYTCRATNTVGTGKSPPLQITVEYAPRKTNISNSKEDKKVVQFVRVGNSLTFYCITDANPTQLRFSWYRYNNNKQIDSSQWTSRTSDEDELRLNSVQRADEACYRCNATNSIGTGEDSEPVCIQVLYAPTEPTLSMDAEVREDQLITIGCTVESFPLSSLTLRRTSQSNSRSSEWHFTQPDNYRPSNTLQHTFNVTSTHAGFYTCDATNSEGSKTSTQRKLVVNYRPKGVTIQAEPALVVNENQSLVLHCSAQSHPPVTSVTWMKMTDGKSEIIGKTRSFTLKTVGPSDSGLYSCTASNDFGSGNSKQAEVKVKYAPKHTKITLTAEQQQPDGTRSVTLSCSSLSYPPVTQYSWYKKTAEEQEEKVSDRQNYTVYSDQPGVYYCTAKNEINQRSSDPVRLFDRGLIKVLFIFLFLIILLIIFLIVFVYRHKKKSSQRGTPSTLPCFGLLGWWNGARRRRSLMNDHGMAEPFRSRDDLLPDQPLRPNAQRRQPRPDSTPASNISTVYCTVNLPSGKQGPSAQNPIRKQGGHTKDDSLNYASLQFGNKQKNKAGNAEEDVYAMVSKEKPPKQNEERLQDYENVSTQRAARSLNPLNNDTDASEDEAEISYSQVSFKAKPGHQRAGRDSSSSDEAETQYSKVKV